MDTRLGVGTMKLTYDADGNADLEEVAFAEKGISAILEYVDPSPAPRDATDAAMCLLGRSARELAEATESHGNLGNEEPTR
jgi:hypothetical protein